MTALNPQWLWELGFRLSEGATLGLVLYAEPLHNAVEALAGRWLAAPRARHLALLVYMPRSVDFRETLNQWPSHQSCA